MKKVILIVLALASISGCTTKTEYGKCIGAFEDKQPNLVYKVSAKNLTLGIIFSEIVYPPISVILNSTWCPIGYKS